MRRLSGADGLAVLLGMERFESNSPVREFVEDWIDLAMKLSCVLATEWVSFERMLRKSSESLGRRVLPVREPR